MSRRNVVCLCVVVTVLLFTAVGSMAKPCPSPVPLQVVISPTYTFGGSSTATSVTPDSTSPYVDGVNGVSAVINGCTHDAVISLSNSTRTMGLSLQNAVATNSSTPSWTSTVIAAKANVTILNLLYAYDANATYSFTTSATFSFTGPDGIGYQLQFVNPSAQNAAAGGTINQPYYTSLVVVTHIAADPTTGAPESWSVQPDNSNMNPAGTPAATQVGGLLKTVRSQSVNAGQFSVPFQFTITRK